MKRYHIALVIAAIALGIAAGPAASSGPPGDHFVGAGTVAFTDFPNVGDTTSRSSSSSQAAARQGRTRMEFFSSGRHSSTDNG
jgi:hypothetical protein